MKTIRVEARNLVEGLDFLRNKRVYKVKNVEHYPEYNMVRVTPYKGTYVFYVLSTEPFEVIPSPTKQIKSFAAQNGTEFVVNGYYYRFLQVDLGTLKVFFEDTTNRYIDNEFSRGTQVNVEWLCKLVDQRGFHETFQLINEEPNNNVEYAEEPVVVTEGMKFNYSGNPYVIVAAPSGRLLVYCYSNLEDRHFLSSDLAVDALGRLYFQHINDLVPANKIEVVK